VIALDDLRRQFTEIYGTEPRLFRAPGRVNLIGEHTDYNDGFVLPMAINRETMVAGVARTDRKLRVYTANLNKSAEFNLDVASPLQRGNWTGYVEGMARSVEADGARLTGADLLISSDVPVGAGLSSSAALEISVGYALLSLAGAEIDRVKLALAGQRAENEYTGARTGIMDQFISARGRAGNALLIDCRSLEAELVPLNSPDAVIAICDTGVKHSLASSAYNQRRSECEQGVELLRKSLPDIRALRDVSVEVFRKHEAELPEPVRQRCRHVVTEIKRTLDAVECFKRGDLNTVGQLMYASHKSLRDDYEVSCAELDVLVVQASKINGVYGARMTGGGFGGCTVNLVERGRLDEFQETIKLEYARATNREAKIYISEAANGAEEIKSSQ
jgi:galactokinase